MIAKLLNRCDLLRKTSVTCDVEIDCGEMSSFSPKAFVRLQKKKKIAVDQL